ncbi:MAG: hypothetical protein QOF90_1671 [Acetobacteraceae bacterium]|nr:hypothetical protein [Acetobacteraceae bacterium]
MTSPLIPVSWGELLDKIAILEIKAQRLVSADARGNAVVELELLRRAANHAPAMPELRAALLAVNTRLWRIEDLIRKKEAAGDFGPGFIDLARSVYRENDERARIKRALNQKLRSVLVEEKQYLAY